MEMTTAKAHIDAFAGFRFRLPVSGNLVELRYPTGLDDMRLLETSGDDTILALGLADALARPVGEPASLCRDGAMGGAERLDWLGLSITDLDTLVLRLRQLVIGDTIKADLACPAAECGKPIDISFKISQFLEHHQPSRARPRGRWRISPTEESGWWRLSDTPSNCSSPDVNGESPDAPAPGHSRGAPQTKPEVTFRLPTAADALAVAGRADEAQEMAGRCLRPAHLPGRVLQRVEKALESLAPALSGEMQGCCPECGAQVLVYFDPRQYCLRELRDRAAFIYQDVDTLARRYHWSEPEILALPQGRRIVYAELARQGGGGS